MDDHLTDARIAELMLRAAELTTANEQLVANAVLDHDRAHVQDLASQEQRRRIVDLQSLEGSLRKADRRKDEFLATLAHELRNHLAPVRNGVTLLRQIDGLDERAAKSLDMVERQLGHLVRITDDLLDVSRIGRGAVGLERERLQVRTLVEHVVEASRSFVEAEGHALAVELPDAPVWVHGDPTRLAQVVGNLLTNAAKYTPHGGRITLRVGVEHGEAVIHVTDDGIGIAADMLPRVFDLFVQVDDARDLAQGGLGIGLSLVRTLVELHDGVVIAESPGLGRGSTFTVRLPLAASAIEEAAPRREEAALPRPPSRRVLVVDDDADAAESFAMLLELAGHPVRVAGNGHEALEIAREWQPEVVFLDIGLPGMDGHAVARRLRAHPATAGALLVALTGWGSDEVRRRSEDAGFDSHLVKPVDAVVVADVLAGVSGLERGN